MDKSYRYLDHTGDIGVEVRGRDLPDLLRTASLALMDSIVAVERVRALEGVQWNVEAESEEGLLVAQLQEILYQFDAKGRVFCNFEIRLLAPRRLVCSAAGEALDRERQGFKTEIKAVTYHGLKIENSESGKTVRLIFDV